MAEDLSATPASASATLKVADCRYQVLSKGSVYLYTYPSSSSLVITVANEKLKQLGKSTTKERRDTFRRKTYSSVWLQVRVANCQVKITKYDYLQWERVSDFKDKLPTEIRNEFRSICEERQLSSKISFQAALDAADSGVSSIATAIIMRHMSWLSASGLPTEVQTTIEDLPFDGLGLFNIEMVNPYAH